MINLIGNELKKIFKKKTIYILLIITLAYILLMNIMIKVTDDGHSYHYYYEGDIEYYESMLDSLNPQNASELSDYINYKTQVELLNLTKEYGNESWQAFVINSMLTSDINTIVAHEYSDEITEEAYNEAKTAYDTAIERMDADDWKYFVNMDLEEINSSLEEQYSQKEIVKDSQALASIEDTIYNLELQKQIDEWRLDKNISYAPSFLNDQLQSYYGYQSTVHQYENSKIEELNPEERQDYQTSLEQASLARYYLENNISLDNNGREIFLTLFNNYELFILIIGIVIAGSIVSDEFNKGTIKLLLVKPYNRIKILLSKFIVCLLILVLTIVFIAVCQLVVGSIVFGFDSLTTPAIFYNFDTNRVETMNILAYVGLIGICKMPIYILLTTLAFACSTLFTNSALAIAVPFLGYMSAAFINQLALVYDIKQIIYFVTPNWDFTYYLFGGTPLFDGLTVLFSLAICLIYLLIMIVVSCVVFKRRDIKNI